MATGTRSLRRSNLAVPLGVLGGTALFATALVWGRRRSNGERRAQREGAENDDATSPATAERHSAAPDRESGELQKLESAELPDEEVGLDDLDFLDDGADIPVSTESLPGESYDSVEPEDAGREYLLRATETQPTVTVKVPPGFFTVADDPKR